MSGVKRSPRNSVNDRPSGLRLALRRQRRLLRPAGYIAAVSLVGVAVGWHSSFRRPSQYRHAFQRA